MLLSRVPCAAVCRELLYIKAAPTLCVRARACVCHVLRLPFTCDNSLLSIFGPTVR